MGSIGNLVERGDSDKCSKIKRIFIRKYRSYYLSFGTSESYRYYIQ